MGAVPQNNCRLGVCMRLLFNSMLVSVELLLMIIYVVLFDNITILVLEMREMKEDKTILALEMREMKEDKVGMCL